MANRGWDAVTNASFYTLSRTSDGSNYQPLGNVPSPTTSVTDPSASPDTFYFYVVYAYVGGQLGPASYDIATTMTFTDDPLTAGTVIKAVHITQLRTAVNGIRALAHLTPTTFTDSSLAGTFIKAIHITELRTSMNQARQSLALSQIPFADPTLTPNVTVIKATQLQELRAGVK